MGINYHLHTALPHMYVHVWKEGEGNGCQTAFCHHLKHTFFSGGGVAFERLAEKIWESIGKLHGISVVKDPF